MKQTPEQTIATALLVYLASGGTLDRLLTKVPTFSTQLQRAFDWMKSNAQCTAAELQVRAERLREVIQRKDEAVRGSDFDRAAELRAEECALSQSLGLGAPTGYMWSAVLRVGIEEQIRQLSELLNPKGKC
jgi:hypothetical protein